jgi:hypothetical protein
MSAPKATSAIRACAIILGIFGPVLFLAAPTTGVQVEMTSHVMMAMLAPVTIDVKAARARGPPYKDALPGGNVIPMQTAMMAFPAPATGAMNAGGSAKQSPFVLQVKAAIPALESVHARPMMTVPAMQAEEI